MAENYMNYCPFCKGQVTILSVTDYAPHKIIEGEFQCDFCGAEIKLRAMYFDDKMDALLRTWNRRVDDG